MSALRSTLLEDAMQDSWVDLGAPSSRDSTGSVIINDAYILSSHSSKHSPQSLHSPNQLLADSVTLKPNLEAVKFKLARHMKPQQQQQQKSATAGTPNSVSRDTDWLWDWSSRPEAIPPKSYRFRHPGGSLTTPPNSPVQTPGGTIRCYYSPNYALSLRHTKLIRSDWFSVELVSFFIVSNILSLCLGFWICRKLAQTNAAI